MKLAPPSDADSFYIKNKVIYLELTKEIKVQTKGKRTTKSMCIYSFQW